VEEEVPREYLCFCGQIRDPEWNPYATPHSCGSTCSRIRTGTSCPHPCTLLCHPGPCPTCKVKVPDGRCHCGRTSYPLRCGEFDKGRACEATCGRLLGCGLHRCEDQCHREACSPCAQTFERECYCGRSHQVLACGSGKEIKTGDRAGFYSCEKVCGRALSCGNHHCAKPCHAGDCPPCDRLPQLVRTCPCGTKPVTTLLPSPRQTCLDPIPTCGGVCNKALACVGNSLGISKDVHLCQAQCHTGECPPCTNAVEFNCRCGTTKHTSVCSNETPASIRDYVCKRVCKDMRSCGKHQCSMACCTKSEDAHRCKLTCNKKLQCGLHTCMLSCHKGHCYPCLQANFDEVSCFCGETRLYPPIPCGVTLPPCPYPCTRPRSCPHPPSHNCHTDDACPPCMIRLTKPCACYRKTAVPTVCSKPFGNCGRPCERQLPSCGHLCPRICHESECELSSAPCKQTCGRKRRCGHKCQAPCHGAAPCPSIPCAHEVEVTCKCGRKNDRYVCGKIDGVGGINRPLPACDEQCMAEERRIKLAHAFDIDLTERSPPTPEYPRILYDYCSKNTQFVLKVEETFRDLLRDPRKAHHNFQPMKKEQRSFIHLLGLHYNLTSESVDPEPRRSVIIRKKMDSKEPAVLLSTACKRGEWISMPLLVDTPPPSFSFSSL